MFFKRKPKIDFSKMPKHVGFIMDGNGRWAKRLSKPRSYGHKIGAEAFVSIIKHANKLGIKVVSFYAFSTENWNRPKEEIDQIFSLVLKEIKENKNKLVENNYVLRTMGDLTKLPQELQSEISDCIIKTQNNTGLIVNIGVNYGGRAEIVRAVNMAVEKGETVTEESFKNLLYTNGLPDLDFVVRTSGEKRVSNFMLYQLAYAELYFPKIFWPAFREKQLDNAIVEYQKRHRRFGKI